VLNGLEESSSDLQALTDEFDPKSLKGNHARVGSHNGDPLIFDTSQYFDPRYQGGVQATIYLGSKRQEFTAVYDTAATQNYVVLNDCDCLLENRVGYDKDSTSFTLTGDHDQVIDGVRSFSSFTDSIEIDGFTIASIPFQGITYSHLGLQFQVYLSVALVEASIQANLLRTSNIASTVFNIDPTLAWGELSSLEYGEFNV